jgi:transaldolase
MIKIPGTPEGWPAIETAISEGINVNVTLIFGVSAYEEIMAAYKRGLRAFVAKGNNPARVASVASFFVSRVDSMVDPMIEKQGLSKELLGKAAVANSKIAYQRFLDAFSDEQFGDLRAAGGRVQRPLWASTSTKNPNYSPTIYVDTLIGDQTVNTVPPVTLDAIRNGMTVEETVTRGLDQARRVLDQLEASSISMAKVTEDLRTAGVAAFAESFDQLLEGVESKRQALTTA